MKRLIVLLVILAGGVAAAALLVPTHAAVVNGTSISQQALNSDVQAIASSASYQCYLNSQAYIASNGSEQVAPVNGAGRGQDVGDHPTANTAFVATYLDTKIGHQLVLQLADEHHVTVSQAQLADAEANLSGQISAVMTQILQTPVAQDPRYSCSVTGRPVTGKQVLSTLPTSFVDEQVQFVATASALQEDFAGVGSSEADLQAYFQRHRARFDTACFTAAAFTSQTAAQEAAAEIAYGTPFAEVAAKAAQSGRLQCGPLVAIGSGLPPSAKLDALAVGDVSTPIDVNGAYYLLQLTKRTPAAYATAKDAVSQAVQQAGAKAAQKAITAAERRSSVSVDPRYGVWAPVQATVFAPFTPRTSDVLNAPANAAGVSVAPASSPSG